MQSGTGLKSYLAGFCSPPFKASPSYYSFVEPTTNVFFVVLNTMLLCSTVSDLQEERQAHWDWLRKVGYSLSLRISVISQLTRSSSATRPNHH